MKKYILTHPIDNSLFLTDRECEILKQITENTAEYNIITQRIVKIASYIEEFLLHRLAIPVARENQKVQILLVGYGADGAEEAMAVEIAARRVGIDYICVGFELEPSRKVKTDIMWRIFKEKELIISEKTTFYLGDIFINEQFYVRDTQFPLLVIIKDIPPTSPHTTNHTAHVDFPRAVVEYFIPIMERYHQSGVSSRLLISARKGGPLNESSHVISVVEEIVQNQNSSVKLLVKTENNPHASPSSSEWVAENAVFDGTIVVLGN